MRSRAAWLGVGLLAGLAAGGCSHQSPLDPPEVQQARSDMVERLRGGGQVTDKRVLAALGQVPRHRLWQEDYWSQAYLDQGLALDAQRASARPCSRGWSSKA